jgi:transcriptional regulator
MYAAPAFRMDDREDMAALITARHFATLIVSSEAGPQATHIPMILQRDATGQLIALEGHVARGNPIAALAVSPLRALAIFSGADAYVTPSLYASKREHGKVVPTWNYMAVHVSGVLETFSDAAALHDQVARITDMMEQPAPVPWKVTDAPDDYIAKMLNAITGVRLTIDKIEGIAKLSQNRPEGDRAGVLNGFQHSPDHAARELAAEMTKSDTNRKA